MPRGVTTHQIETAEGSGAAEAQRLRFDVQNDTLNHARQIRQNCLDWLVANDPNSPERHERWARYYVVHPPVRREL